MSGAWQLRISGPSVSASSEVELIVHADADQIFSQADADGNRGASNECSAGSGHARRVNAVKATVAEIDIEPLDLGGPAIGKRPLDTGASGPARLVAGVAGAIEGRLHIGKSAAGGEIQQDAVCCVAGASAHGGEPVIAGLAITAEVADAGSRSGVNGGIVPVALDAKDKSAGLPIDAERAADDAAIIVASPGCATKVADGVRGPFGVAPAPTAVDADIDTGPVVDRQDSRNVCGWRARRRRRQIGSQSRSAKSENDAKKSNDATHDPNPMFADMLMAYRMTVVIFNLQRRHDYFALNRKEIARSAAKSGGIVQIPRESFVLLLANQAT